MLRLLLDANHAASKDEYELPDGSVMRAEDFFVPTTEADIKDIGAFRGRWGQVFSIGRTDGSVWLNTGDRSKLSFVATDVIFAGLLVDFHLDDAQDLIGSDILVLGVAGRSANGKLYAPICDAEHVTLRTRPS